MNKTFEISDKKEKIGSWSAHEVSINPNITMEIIENNLDKNWNWRYVSGNPNLTIDFVKAHLDKPWSWKFISFNSMYCIALYST